MCDIEKVVGIDMCDIEKVVRIDMSILPLSLSHDNLFLR